MAIVINKGYRYHFSNIPILKSFLFIISTNSWAVLIFFESKSIMISSQRFISSAILHIIITTKSYQTLMNLLFEFVICGFWSYYRNNYKYIICWIHWWSVMNIFFRFLEMKSKTVLICSFSCDNRLQTLFSQKSNMSNIQILFFLFAKYLVNYCLN